MNDLVHSIVHKRLLSALRLPSFAGRGLPERMRSTAFALLGMTAAAALFLVAIFAQLSFPLVEPAPLPGEPATHLAGAERVTPGGSSGGRVSSAAPARAAEPGSGSGGTRAGSPAAASPSPEPATVPGDSTSVPAPSATGAPDGADAPAGNAGGGSGSTQPASPSPAGQAPADAPQPSGSGSVVAPTPSPVAAPPKATTSTPPPAAPPAPGNSSSTAAAEHASDRGIEASSSSGPTAEAVTAEPADPGGGNGLAKGHSK